MKLTRNERLTISFLIKNARTTDTEIARKLNISLQAVRNIRKKLERNKIIKSYSTVIDPQKIDINLFAIALLRVTSEAWGKFKEDAIQKWLLHPNVVNFYRIPNSDVTHIIKYGFSDLNEMQNFFQTMQAKCGKYIEIQNCYTISNGNVIKDSSSSLIENVINGKNGAAKPFTLE